MASLILAEDITASIIPQRDSSSYYLGIRIPETRFTNPEGVYNVQVFRRLVEDESLPEDSLEKVQNAKPNGQQLTLGKRIVSHRYGFGLGKREIQRYGFGLGKRKMTRYNFGLGKREVQ